MQFYNFQVTHIHKTIRDAVVLTLEPEVESNGEFAFVPGQYLTFRKDFDGEELRRSYSICAGLNDGALQVGIKRVDGGTFSTWANVDLAVGDIVEVMPPMGNFHAISDKEQPRYIAFAGGSGITPILSIIKSGLQQNTQARYSLVYANRGANTIMFREEIEDLKNRYLDRFTVVHILEDESEEIDLFRGRVDSSKCGELFSNWINIDVIDMAYICGPEPMMLGIKDALQAHGLRNDQIRFELFGNAQPGRSKQRAKSVNTHKEGVAGQVTLNAETRTLVIPDGSTLLEAAIANNIDAPFACKAGVCSSCKAKVLEGEVEMMANHALEDDQVNAGFVLTCQCLPLSASVVWDYDQAGH